MRGNAYFCIINSMLRTLVLIAALLHVVRGGKSDEGVHSEATFMPPRGILNLSLPEHSLHSLCCSRSFMHSIDSLYPTHAYIQCKGVLLEAEGLQTSRTTKLKTFIRIKPSNRTQALTQTLTLTRTLTPFLNPDHIKAH